MSDGFECKWNAQFGAVAEGDAKLRRDRSLECREKGFELHLEAQGTEDFKQESDK